MANPFTIEDPRIIEALKARRIQASKVNETTLEDLRQVLSDAVEEGLTTTQIGDRFADYYSNQIGESAARPMTAARTQVAGVVNDGQMAAARAAGGTLKKIWIHGGSAEPRPAHLAAQGRYAAGIGLDEKFEINGHLCDAPGDSSLPVGESANCTCMVGFIPA